MTVEKIVFIVVCSIVLVSIIALILYFPCYKSYYFRNFKKIYGKAIYRIALDYDFFLINNFTIRPDDDNIVHIDHLLFGDKYIYIIKDRFYRGAIEGKEFDKSWFYYRNKKSRIYIDNPLITNYQRLKRFSYSSNIDEKLLISIVVVNNNCLINPFVGVSKDNYIVPVGKLRKLIKAIESRNVPLINAKQLQYAVNDLARINSHQRKDNKKPR